MVIFHSYVKLPEGIIINFPQFSPVFISFLSLHGPRQVWSRRSASPTATLPVAPKLRPWSMAGGLRRIRWGGWWSYGTSPDFHGILMDFQRIDEDFSIFSSIWINFSASNGGFWDGFAARNGWRQWKVHRTQVMFNLLCFNSPELQVHWPKSAAKTFFLGHFVGDHQWISMAANC